MSSLFHDPSPLTRRRFARKAGASAAALAMATAASPALSLASAKPKRVAPSDRLTLGFIGMGTMNRGHLNRFLGRDDVQVVAVCDVDASRRNDAKTKVDQKYSAAKEKGSDSQSCAAFKDFRELLARQDIDAVVIATPDHWHAIPVIEACKAKKDIYCEKPLSLTILEAKRMMDAVRKHERVLQTGSQQRTEFNGRFRIACEYVRSGRIGKLETVHVGVGAPSQWCDLPEEPMEPGLDWEM